MAKITKRKTLMISLWFSYDFLNSYTSRMMQNNAHYITFYNFYKQNNTNDKQSRVKSKWIQPNPLIQ